jgi:hypothetical protein
MTTAPGVVAVLASAVISWGIIAHSIFTTTASQTRPKPPIEQTEFGSDSGLDRPIAIPRNALDALRSALKAAPDELIGDDLKASEIHLAGPAEANLIVPRPVGSHSALFYLLKPTAGGYKLIFDSGGDSMTVLRSRSHGYRDLKVWSFTQTGKSQSTALYKFDGARYVKLGEKDEQAN